MKTYEDFLHNPPKVFISYSWSNEKHINRVIDLARRLSQDGIDIKFDLWDLKEGQDKYIFMEQMVSDESVVKVLMICDKMYMEKANGRKGGVGDETQIISPEIYNDTEQTKFIPIVFDKDNLGNAYLPAYLKGRIYIDLSDPDTEENEYEKMIRSIFERPENLREPLGQPPTQIFAEEVRKITKTNSIIRKLKRSVKNGENISIGIFEDYLDQLILILKNDFVIDGNDVDQPFDDIVIQKINDFLIYRDEFIDLINEITKYNKDLTDYDILIHGFFEKLINLSYPKSNQYYWDQYRFITWELFLYSIALTVYKRIIKSYQVFIDRKYLITDKYNTELRDFTIIFDEIGSLKYERKKRLNVNHQYLAIDELKKRTNKIISFDLVMQAELILFLRSFKHNTPYTFWFPATLIYSSGHGTNFEFFIRAEEESEFLVLLEFIGHKGKDELIDSLSHNPYNKSPYFGGFFSFAALTNIDKLGTN